MNADPQRVDRRVIAPPEGDGSDAWSPINHRNGVFAVLESGPASVACGKGRESMGFWGSFRTVVSRTTDLALVASLGYMTVAVAATVRFGRRRADAGATTPPVTLLVPLHGTEFSLEANLRAFATQDYPAFQIVFGVARADDAALPFARRIAAEMPGVPIDIAIGFDPAARNPKLANVLSMMRYVKHDVLVLADSDTLVDPAYLRTVTAPLGDPEVGAVTALFSGHPDTTFASRLGAMFMNEQFIPAALVERFLGPLRHCFGPTNAFRAETLRAIGGFEALAPHLADDYMLGNFIAAHGRRVVISSYVVKTTISERSVPALFTHELRWHRTIRGVKPLGYAGVFVTYPIALALLRLLTGRKPRRAVLQLAAALASRIALQRVAARALDVVPAAMWMTVPRDLLGFALWVWGLGGSSVRWRGADLAIGEGDMLVEEPVAP
jgi:ceramide glucosyltransferase